MSLSIEARSLSLDTVSNDKRGIEPDLGAASRPSLDSVSSENQHRQGAGREASLSLDSVSSEAKDGQHPVTGHGIQ